MEVIGAYSETGGLQVDGPVCTAGIVVRSVSKALYGTLCIRHETECNPCTDSLPESFFGAAVPNNYERNLRTLLAEMYDDKDYKSAQDKLEGLYQQS